MQTQEKEAIRRRGDYTLQYTYNPHTLADGVSTGHRKLTEA